jgi:hypothetical protein
MLLFTPLSAGVRAQQHALLSQRCYSLASAGPMGPFPLVPIPHTTCMLLPCRQDSTPADTSRGLYLGHTVKFIHSFIHSFIHPHILQEAVASTCRPVRSSPVTRALALHCTCVLLPPPCLHPDHSSRPSANPEGTPTWYQKAPGQSP